MKPWKTVFDGKPTNLKVKKPVSVAVQSDDGKVASVPVKKISKKKAQPAREKIGTGSIVTAVLGIVFLILGTVPLIWEDFDVSNFAANLVPTGNESFDPEGESLGGFNLGDLPDDFAMKAPTRKLNSATPTKTTSKKLAPVAPTKLTKSISAKPTPVSIPQKTTTNSIQNLPTSVPAKTATAPTNLQNSNPTHAAAPTISVVPQMVQQPILPSLNSNLVAANSGGVRINSHSATIPSSNLVGNGAAQSLNLQSQFYALEKNTATGPETSVVLFLSLICAGVWQVWRRRTVF